MAITNYMMLRDRKPDLIAKAQPLYEMLMRGAAPVYILGTNETALQASRVLKEIGRDVGAFIDDYGTLQTFGGHPVVATKGVPSHAVVLTCSTAVYPTSALQRVKAAGIPNVLDYFSAYICGRSCFQPPKFCSENISDVEANREKYDWVYSILTDDISRDTLQKLLEFRYNFDLTSMEGFRQRLDEQYFEPFVLLAPEEIFLDGGGFNGDTTKAFAKRCPGYKKVYYFEPDPALMMESRRRLNDLPSIEYHQLAIGDREAEVSFNQTGTGSGAVSANGRISVQSRGLDRMFEEPPTFIKLDIEGAELAALSGAADLIRATRPKMAVCVYHRQSDFWRVPEKVLSLCSGYRVYLRHYTEGVEETVMYFV